MDVLVGKKKAMAYVLAIVTGFNAGENEITIKARGRSISTAVDTAEIVKSRFVPEAKITDIKIGTEQVEQRAVSTIEITMKK